MADVITRLKVDSSEYDNKIKRATVGLQNYEEACRKAGGTLEYVDDEAMAFARSLGSMQTVSDNTRGKMRELTNAIADMSMMYKNMSEEEKKSPFGKAISASINELRGRAVDCKLELKKMSNEINAMASPTQFADGMSLVTSTVGAAASAITAWTGESKTMDEMFKSLAKVETTVRAINAVTKAFQAQNLVLLKNPYVLVASAAAALIAILVKLAKEVNAISAAEQAIQDVEQAGRNNSASEVARISALNDILHDNTRSLEERKNALVEIQNIVPDYHGSLSEEGTLINDNTSALDSYITNLQRAATAQAAFDKMVELQRKKMDVEVKLQDARTRRDQLKASMPTTIVTGGAGAISGMSAVGLSTATANTEVSKLEKQLLDIDSQWNALQSLITVNDISPKQVGGSKGGRVSKSTPISVSNNEVIGILNKQAELVNKLREAWYAETDAEMLSERKQAYDDAANKLNEMLGKVKEIQESGEQIVVGSLPYLREQLNAAYDELDKCVVGTEEWSDALIRVKDAQDAVNNAQSLLDIAVNGQKTQKPDGQETTIIDAGGQLAGALSSISSNLSNLGIKIPEKLDRGISIFESVIGILQAISSITTVIQALMFTMSIRSFIPFFSHGGTVHAAHGYSVPGNSLSGDNVPILANSGEVVMNRAQTANIASQLKQASILSSLHLETYLQGETIRIALSNSARRRGGSRGEYAISRNY